MERTDKLSAIWAYDSGNYLNQIHDNFLCLRLTGSFIKYLDTKFQIAMCDTKQKNLRAFYKFYFQYQKLLCSGYNYTQLLGKRNQMKNALDKYPEYATIFSNF